MKQNRPLSYSALKQFDISPNHLLAYWNRDIEPSAAQIKGTLIHTLTLEADKFDEQYAIFEGKVKRGKAYDEFVESNEGKKIISVNDYNEASLVKAAVWENESVKELFNNTNSTEELIRWRNSGGMYKGFVDGIGDDFIFDLKTCASSEPVKFTNDCFKYGYAMQGAMYLNATGKKDYYIIAVENKLPFNVTLFKMSDELLAYGLSEFERIVANYNAWDGEPVGYSDIVLPLGFPAWYNKNEKVDIF